MTKSQCGTNGGFQAHKRAGEEPCEPCREASRAYLNGYRATPAGRARTRMYARAGDRARRRLAQLYPDEYRLLYDEALAELHEEART